MERDGEDEEIGDLSFLPEGVIANVLSFTTPIDACTAAAVSRVFNAAAQSDFVWDRFLPPDWDVLISHRKSFDPLSSSKKDIFFSLCNNPVPIDDRNKVTFPIQFLPFLYIFCLYQFLRTLFVAEFIIGQAEW